MGTVHMNLSRLRLKIHILIADFSRVPSKMNIIDLSSALKLAPQRSFSM